MSGVDYMKLIAYSISEGGGMNGGYFSTSIAYTDDGRCRVSTSTRPFHNQPTRHVRYFSDGLLDKLSLVCERYNVISWTNLPEHKIFMHDAATTNICYTFENGTKIVLGDRTMYPEYFSEMHQEFNKLIDEAEQINVEEKIEETLPFLTMGMMAAQLNQPKATWVPVSQTTEDPAAWAKFCADCGAKFTGNQKFCPECGSVRQKL